MNEIHPEIHYLGLVLSLKEQRARDDVDGEGRATLPFQGRILRYSLSFTLPPPISFSVFYLFFKWQEDEMIYCVTSDFVRNR